MAATTDYQVQMHIIDQYGNQQDMSPKNTASDVKVGRMSSGSLVLPASGDNEMLITTIQNIRKYLSNLSDVASQVRTVTSDTTDRSNINIPTTAVTSDICDKIDGLDERFQAVTDLANTKSPMSHAATDLTHGGATGSKYGHVKLSDVYATQQANGAAEHSVGASQNALNAAWANLNAEKAPNNHAVAANTYGPATGSAYGHVKTTDVYNSDNADGSMVATQRALYRAWLELTNKNNSQDTAIAGKAPTSHVSGGTEYGIGTTGGFGHLKVWDNMADQVQSDSGRAANAVAASSYAVKRAYDDLKSKVDTKLANTHSGEKATDSAFSHVKLSDAFVTSGGAASSGVGASSKAVCDLNADISTRLTAINSTITGVSTQATTNKTEIANMKTNFQDGVDTLYNKCVAKGATPTAKTPSAIASAIDKIYTDRYNSGVTAGKSAGTLKGVGGWDRTITHAITAKNAAVVYALPDDYGKPTSAPSGTGGTADAIINGVTGRSGYYAALGVYKITNLKPGTITNGYPGGMGFGCGMALLWVE